MAFTWTELLDDIKIRGGIPTSQSTFTESRLLSLTNSVLSSSIVPFIDRTREAFYSRAFDFTLGSDSSFLLPKRASGAKIEGASFISGTQKVEAIRYWEQEIEDTETPPYGRHGYYLKGNRIYVLPSDGGGYDTLRVSAVMRPNKIVAQSSCAQITAINTGTHQLTFASCPSSWSTSDTFDLIQEDPHFDSLAIDQAISALTSTTMTFSSLPSDLSVGDWISLAGESTVIQTPVEVNPLLAQEVSNLVLKSLGQKMSYELGLAETRMMREAISEFLNPRAEEQAKIIVNKTGHLRRRM